MAEIKSGKVKKTPPSEVSEDRHEFLSLAEAEPDLGVPSDDNYVLTSDTDGVRTWQSTASLVGPTGPTGPQGAIGPTGATGPTGPEQYVTVSDTAPVSPAEGEAWYNSSDGRTYIYYNDGNTNQWVEFGNANVGNQLVGGAARPLLTGGAYLSGSGLVLSGLTSNYASSPDSAALSITGDIDIKVKVKLDDWTPAGSNALISKYGGAPQNSFIFDVASLGYLRFRWSADGTNVLSTTSDLLDFADGATKWVRVTMDVDNGASQRVIKFYTSDDGTSWTEIAAIVTGTGTTSIFDSTYQLEIGSGGPTGARLSGTVYRTIIQSAYDTANNTSNLVFDANFETATADALAFTESSSNAATVTINTTRYTVGLPNVDFNAVTTLATTDNRDYYSPFIVTSPTVVDMFVTEVSSAAGAASTMQLAIYSADNNQQPFGSPLVTDSISIGNGASGVFRKQFSALTLQPGTYVLAHNHSSTSLTLRALRGGQTLSIHTVGSSPMATELWVGRSTAVFSSTPTSWNNFTGSSGGPFLHRVLLRWKAA